ncbi:hypothetical protein GUK36_12270 [Rhizobium leguminosarum]|uniref:SIR2-like domain-containing protein n=1 Tax=Rhizobium leguminosarum TaxID=384 RepID=A0A6P0DFG3_RHILE|nr:hypothetical protein [Rhizobium leguminosarum]NEK50201.1 hypothetical protein [Rhizobium leguminosarum]
MFRNQTTFVIGAGASAEFGLPVGWELAKRIKNRATCIVDGLGRLVRPVDDVVSRLVEQHYGHRDAKNALEALRAINAGIRTAVSIDAFIDRFKRNEDVVTLGKLLIALEIAVAERGSLMHPEQIVLQSFNSKSTTADDTWIGSFARILMDGVGDPSEVGQNISIICFNYDRCIEHYLTEAISAAYDIESDYAAEIVNTIEIIHPYGTLGSLPISRRLGRGILQFGPKLEDDVDWMDIADKNIKTYTQQQHDPAMVEKIHAAIADCNMLVFLGFGFNNQNLDLLRVSPIAKYGEIAARNIYSTGYGIAQQVNTTIKRRILHLLWDTGIEHDENRGRVQIEYGQTCAALFQTHNMNFSSFSRSFFLEEAEGSLRRVSVSSNSED